MSIAKKIFIGGLIFVAGFFSSIALISGLDGPTTAENVADYTAALQKARQTPAPEPGSETETEALNRWKDLLTDLTEKGIKGRVLDVYADELFFNDTLKTHHTGKAVETHLMGSAVLLDSGGVKYLSEMREANGDYFIHWEMSYAGPKLNGGEPIVTIGMSQLRFNEAGKVIFHQDFWDSTAGVFEHIPVLGGPIRYVRSRL